MGEQNRILYLWMAVLVGGVVSGCAAAIACRPGDSTVDCCVKKYPLSPLENCTGNPAEVLGVLREISLRIEDEEFDNNKDLPEWKQECIKNYVHCMDDHWAGPCYECIRRCEGQHKWPLDMCPPLEGGE